MLKTPNRPPWPWILWAAWGTAAALACECVADDGRLSFDRSIRPVLSEFCFPCHGPDSAAREADLRLDQYASATAKRESGHRAIVPGDPDASEAVRRLLSQEEDEVMPPPEFSKRPNEAQVQAIKEWIARGAKYEMHWAFVAPQRPSVPPLAPGYRAVNAIDHFVAARLNEAGLAQAPMASRETLIRRAAFDLTGLPPTLQEVDDFLNDTSPNAYERMVDRYLASPAYGEHMARHWLDLARYADSNGYQYDTERQQWVWRDWVIHAYNRNLPFDQFTIDQLAGDLLPNATPQQRLATGFNRNHGITIEGGVIDEEYRTEYVMDRVVTTGTVWMGLTLGCARCHNHKYDPISQREFYQLFAFFNQVPEGGRGFKPQEVIPSPLAEGRVAAIDRELEQLRAELRNPVAVDGLAEKWAERMASVRGDGWVVMKPQSYASSGASTMTRLPDQSLLVGGANPRHDVYEIEATVAMSKMTAVRLEALTHESLPGGGPGRHSNSNFVLSEFELYASPAGDHPHWQRIPLASARAEYSQRGYDIRNAIDGKVTGNNGWAVDGPTRKKPVTAIFVAQQPFGYAGGTRLRVRLRHEANFATHGIGRVRLSVAEGPPNELSFRGLPREIAAIVRLAASKRSPDEQRQLREYFLQHHDPRTQLKQRIADLTKQRSAAYPATMIMQDMATPRPTYFLFRGQYNEPRDEVTADVPSIFPELPAGVKRDRLALARWLVSADHPLTARVAVNRYWQRLFGVGLVKTAEDFGVQGELPSHPELLDWLACEFIESGWDVKRMHKLIMMSATYRQAANVGRQAYLRDPENRLLARGPHLRLDAEEIRDAALAASGLLVKRLGGKSVYPYQPPGLWLELNNRPGYSKAYPQGHGAELYRRSLYTFWKRTVPSPMLKTFDAPEREFCTVRRSRTNTPLQALLLMNGPQFVEAARKLAERMIMEGGPTDRDRLSYGFRLVMTRRPTNRELDLLCEALSADRAHLKGDAEQVQRMISVGESPRNQGIDALSLAAYTEAARLMLNLSEAITKG